MSRFNNLISAIKTRNLYAVLLIIQLIDVVNVMVISALINKGLIDIPPLVHGMMQFFIILILNCIALIFVRRFAKRRILFFIYIGAVVFSVLCLFMTESLGGGGFGKEDIKALR